MTKTIFSEIPRLVRAPRVTGLEAARNGLVIATRRVVDEGGAAFVDQLFEVGADGARQLTHGEKSATLLAVGERDEVYFSREDAGAEKKGDVVWMLPPKGEAREIFRYHAGIEEVAATTANLVLTLNVLPGGGEGGDLGEGGKSGGAPQSELWSPHRFVDQIRVPMLVIHGDKDYRVPISQGLELWFDLQRTSPELGHQYLYYPDEGHWILKPGNAQVWYETFLDFLDSHRERR